MILAIPTIAHLPNIYLTKDKVAETIADLDKVGVQKSLLYVISPDVEPLKGFPLCNGFDRVHHEQRSL